MTSISARRRAAFRASGGLFVWRCPSTRCSTTRSWIHRRFVERDLRLTRPCFIKGHYGDCSRVATIMADADQSFPVLEYAVLRLEDCKWLPARLLPDDNVMETESRVRCFEDSLLCREPGSSVSTDIRAENWPKNGTYRDATNRAPLASLTASPGLLTVFAASKVAGAAAGCFSRYNRRVSLAAVRSSGLSIRLTNLAEAGPFSIFLTLDILQISVPTLNGSGKGATLDAIFRSTVVAVIGVAMK